MKTRKKKKHTGRTVFLVLILVLAFLLIDSNFRVQVTEYDIESSEIPKSFEGFRILQLSDLHNREFGEENEELLGNIKGAKPDIIVVTGDLADAACEDLEGFVRPLMEGLTGIAPTFYVSGNHEWAAGFMEELFDLLEDCGVTALRNDYVAMEKNGERIILAGCEDPNGPYDMMTPEELVADIREAYGDSCIIMLNHRNDALGRFADLGVALVLSGHGHGGIIRLPFTDGLIDQNREWLPTYTSGIYVEGETQMVVSRGLGWHVAIPRFLNNPHIPVVVLHAS